MTENSEKIRILCYGDSNTWGCKPKHNTWRNERYPYNVRWTGILQHELGNAYEVISEGLNGRATCLDDPDPEREGRNGLTYLGPCLRSQDPIHLVILFLGTNDLKEKFQQTPEQIGMNLEKLIQIIQDPKSYESGKVPLILLLTPPPLDDTRLLAAPRYKGATEKGKQLIPILEATAQKYRAGFINLHQYLTPGVTDGIHFEVEDHAKLAALLKEAVLAMLTGK